MINTKTIKKAVQADYCIGRYAPKGHKNTAQGSALGKAKPVVTTP